MSDPVAENAPDRDDAQAARPSSHDLSSDQPSPLTLRFASETLEHGFRDHYVDDNRTYFRAICAYVIAITAAISLVGVFLDFSINEEGVHRLVWMGTVPVTALCLAALYVPQLASRVRAITVLYMLGMGIVFMVFNRLQPPSFIEYWGYSYLLLLLFFMFPLGRLSLPTGAAIAAVLVAAHALALADLGVDRSELVRQIALLVMSAVLGYSIAHLLELNARRGYLAQRIIEEQSDELRRDRRRLAESESRLRAEKERSDALLRSVLPEVIADRITAEGTNIADGFAEATVLFSDIVGFTTLSQTLGPHALVELLNDLFTGFDELTERHGLEKIKTIGDAYMVAGAVPEYRRDHADAIARLALDMREYLRDFNRTHDTDLDIRVGIHTGPVVAGIIGKKKFAYDLWGDAVNVASRMESHGVAGEIQVTESTYHLLSRHFELERRGRIEVKGKGEIDTYLLKRVREPPGRPAP